ncbi:MAG: hypothetical protein ABIU05_02010 [Nitrospirales bacterium]
MSENGLRFNGVVRNNSFHGLGFVGVYFSVDTTFDALQMAIYDGYEKGRMVSWPDRAERLQMCFAALRELEARSAQQLD